ncbi:MAG TPA: nitrite reductase large subunit NirB [Gammaproteobacteria bacterium]|nr:nitrite reductase large subunit NirB [Gammaproteobacteria bacterium]
MKPDTGKQSIVIVGNGMVGHKLVESLIERGAHERCAISVLCEEPRLAYDRVHLSEYFSGKTAAELALTKEDFYQEHGIRIYLADAASIIDRADKSVTSAQGLRLHYDKLVLATGSYPFVPPIPGNNRSHCHVYRTIEDLEAMQASGKLSKTGAVVGGGLLGLECANALKNMGLETHVVEFAPRLMTVQVDDMGGALLRRKIEKLGVQVHTSKNTTAIGDGGQYRHRMQFADGSFLEVDMIVFSAGIRPRDQLARDCGLTVGERGGIVIDNHCRTSDPDIYAIGECALWNRQIFGLVAPGYQMAGITAAHLLGEDKQFTGADMSTKLKLMGVDVASIGDAQGRSQGAKNYYYADEGAAVYKKIVVSDDGKRLLGAVLVGDAADYGTLLQTMLNGIELPQYPDSLILPERGGKNSKRAGVAALPNGAQICSCHNVDKAALCTAISAGNASIGALKACTKAGTGCGGCVPLVTQILNHELARQGVAVKRDICEHFPYSRQQLYHLVRIGQIRSFEEMLRKHGKGNFGCDVCKPTVASILAACWNEYVLKKQHAGLQDTNDHFLANMQKNGTYSIVPRIAGGEITPEKLIVLGRVAQKYKLYTKITGGQRIDLFGAQVHELPLIWKELVDAGFETGHAYGKAVRTVKSCVGSTWCRYGVLDSVGMAIQIENRYKGLRAPHKLKFAVSGCTRECAEAQSKDIGVIATENGWNLYTCGNGGMKPRHADLFATGLSDEMLIRYIDRILMFYIRTADRLQRTSVWFENLEGGLDYLRAVVIDDKLGICAELEREMHHVIGTYECEWKKTIEDPEQLKRFRTFINSEQQDGTVVFVEERSQIRPATREEKLHFHEINRYARSA